MQGRGPQAGSTCSTAASCSSSLPGMVLQRWNGVSIRCWQDLEGKPCALGGLGGGQTRQGASTLPCSVFLWAGGGHGSALQSEIKEGAPLLPPGLQQQHNSCQVWLAGPPNEQAQRAQQLPAALCELRASTPELQSPVGAVQETRAISTSNPSGQGARDNRAGKGAGEAFGKETEALSWLFTLSDKEKSRNGESQAQVTEDR